MSKEVRLTLVGSLTISRSGRVWAMTDVGSRKARMLLALLAVERDHLVTVDRIAEVLWGTAPPRRLAENVSTLVSRLRMAFGGDVITGGRSGYRLGSHVSLDLDEATELVTEADRRLAAKQPAPALNLAQQAISTLDSGGILDDEGDAPWAGPARAQQVTLLRQARRLAAEAALRTWNTGRARSVSEAAISADPLDEAAYRLLMRAHAALGEPARALAAFERLRSTLADELGVDPAPATRDLHVAILRGKVTGSMAQLNGDGFAGRDSELAYLSVAWESVSTGGPRVVLICGEAGIGKTGLAEQVARKALASGGTLARARCREAERSLFLQPFVELLSQLAVQVPTELLHSEVERRQIFEAIADALRRHTSLRPALLIIDDLHHAGLDTIELLHYLSRHAIHSRFLVLVTVRIEEGQPVIDLMADTADRLELGPLDTATIGRLAQAAGQAGLTTEIEERTRGHTLFVVETLRSLEAGEKGCPAALRADVFTRVRRAGAEAEELLRAAAVLGPSFSPDTVAALLDIGRQDAARRCERLLPTRLIVVSGRGYAFANDIIQEIIYASTPLPTRHAYHQRAGD